MTGEVLKRDVYPAEVVMPDGRLILKARAFVTSERLLVYQGGANRTVELVLDLAADTSAIPANRGTVGGALEATVDGETVWINRGRGCGCGSPLKAMGAPVPWVRR